jgi:hypothetical protein
MKAVRHPARRRPGRGRRRPRILWAGPPGFVVVLVAVLSVPGVALAVFSQAPSPQTASFTAATIAPPTGFTATATGTTTANLSWTAPSTLTGYRLTQSSGTLAGCSSTPSSGTTSCTATGLLPATTYTWTLTADYNNWASTPVQASVETDFAATSLGTSSGDCLTPGTLGCTGPSVTTANGISELILIYAEATGAGTTVSSVTGPFTGAAQVASTAFPATGSTNYLFAWKATGNGAGPTAVTVTFSALTVAVTSLWIDVVQLGTGENPLACSGCTDSGTTAAGSENATVQLTVQHSVDSEIAFLGSTTSGATFTAPAGFTTLAGGGSSLFGSYAAQVVQSPASFSMGATGLNWGSLGLEVQP